MTEYITKEQAELIIESALREYIRTGAVETAFEELYSLPDADVAPVVRCKDCKYAEETYRPDIVRCTNFSTYPDPWKVWRGWYCGDGERKDGGESDD